MMPLVTTVAKQFAGLRSTIYLNTASTGVGPKAAAEALEAGIAAWSAGRFDFVAAERAGEQARQLFAKLINVPTDCIALIPSASAVAGQVAAYLRASASGGNILVGEQEYTSALFAWLQLRSAGYDVRLLPFVGGGVSVDQFNEAADANTRLIAVSAVQSATGYRVDLASLRQVANRSKALLYVDGAQIVGALPLDAAALGIDALAVPSHKFLLGTRGMGYGYFASHLRDAMQPLSPGWKAAAEPFGSFYGPEMALSPTASRFDQSLAWLNALGEVESLKLHHSIGTDCIGQHNSELADHMRHCLIRSMIDFHDHGQSHGSTIFSIQPATSDAAKRLADSGVVASMRNGRVRVALHLYNTSEQVDRVVSLIAAST